MSKYSFQAKFSAYILNIITLGLYVHPAIAKKRNYEEKSLKYYNEKLNRLLWAIFFFCFGFSIVLGMMDSFFLNRAVLVRVLTRIGLISVLIELILEALCSLIKNSDKKLVK